MTKNSFSTRSGDNAASRKTAERQTCDRPVFDRCNVGQRVSAEVYDGYSYDGETGASFYTERPSRIASASDFDRAFNSIH